MERCHKRDKSIETLYMKTRILDKPRVTPILEGKYRMHGPTNELRDLSFSEELLGDIISNNPPREEEHGFKDQINKRYVYQDTLALIKEAFITSDDKQNVNERVNALETCIPEENDEVFSLSRKIKNDLCFEKDMPEKTEEKMKVSGRIGRFKRKFFQTSSIVKDNGSSETERHDTGLNLQFSIQEALCNNLIVESCSNEDQSLHVEKSGSLSAGIVKADFGASHNFEKQSPVVCQEDLEVKKPISESKVVSKLKNCGTCSTATSNHSMRTCIERDDKKVPSQILLEACGSGLTDVCTESRRIYNLETDEDTGRHGNIDLDRDKPLHESCKNCFSAANSGEVVLENAGRKLLFDHVQDSVSLSCQDSGGFDKGKATASIHHTATLRSKNYEGNLRSIIAHAKAKKKILERGEGSNFEDCKLIADSLYEKRSGDVDKSKVIAEGFLQNHPIQGDRQAVKYLDVASEIDVSADWVFSKNESCSIKSKETKILFPVVGTMPFSLSSEDNMLLSQGQTCSPHLEVYLENPKPKQPDENSLLLQNSENRSATVLEVSSIAPLKFQSDTYAVQHGEESMDRLVEEGASKALVKPLEATLMSAAFLEQDLFTLNENKEASPTIQPEEDGKVCDICGDAGYEDLLAVCSACNEGAEHIYCMRIRLMALPEGNWFCEACKGRQEVGDLIKGPCAQLSTLKEASGISYRKKTSENKHFLLSKQCNEDTSDSKGVKIVSGSVPEGDKLVNLGVGTVGVAVSNKQITENADRLQLTSSQAQAQGCMLKGKESSKIKFTVETVSAQLVTLPNGVAALKRQNSRTHSSKPKSSAKVICPVLNTTESGKRKPLASTISADVVVPNLKRQALESSENKLANVSTMPRLEKTSEHSLKVSETSKAKSVSLASQGKRPVGGPATLSSVQSRGKLEVNTSLNVPADPKNSVNFRDVTLTFLPAKLGKVAQEKRFMPSEILGLPLQSRDNTDITTDSTNTRPSLKFAKSNGTSVSQPDATAFSQGLMFPRIKPILATYSNETIADGDIQATPIGESRKVSQGSPYLSSSSHLRLFPTHAADPGNTSTVSRVISSPIPTRCYRCKETGHVAKECIRSLSNHAPDLRSRVSWATAALLNETVRNPPGNEEGNVPCGSFIRQFNCEEPFLSDLARPQHTILWQGGFEVVVEGQSSLYDGIQAHPSTKAVKEVYESTRQLPSRVMLEEVQANFVPNLPDGGLIALYFKAASAYSAGTYMKLLDHMTKHDLVLRGLAITAELLVFTSNRLPQIEQCWNGEKFLWGLFRKRKLSTPKSGGILNPWTCQSSIPSTSYFSRENNEIYSNVTPTVSLKQNFPAQVLEVNTLAVKKLDAADQAMKTFRVDHKQSPFPSSMMTVFPYFQELKPASQPERQSFVDQGFSEAKNLNTYLKGPVMSDGFATGSRNCMWTSPGDFRTEMGNGMFLPNSQTSAGMSIDKSDSTRQRNWLKKNYISGAGKATEQELVSRAGGSGLRSVQPLSKIQFKESFPSHQLHSSFRNRLANDMWDDARLHIPHSSTPSTIRAEGQLRALSVESNFSTEDKEVVIPDLFARDGKRQVSTIVHMGERVLKKSLRTMNDTDIEELDNLQEDPENMLDRLEQLQVRSGSLEPSVSRSGSRSHSSSHSLCDTCSPYRVRRSSSASLPQCGSFDHSQQQTLNPFLQSMNSDLEQASKSIYVMGMEVDEKTFCKEPPKSISSAQSDHIGELYMHFINERAMRGDACKDIICCTEGDFLLRSQALRSQKKNVNTAATKLDSRQEFKETNSGIDSAESSISSGEPFNEQKLSLDAAPRTGHSYVAISTSSYLVQGDMVINTGQLREHLKWHKNISGYAAPHASASRKVQSTQPEACMSLNLELGLGGKGSNHRQELRLIEKLSGFEPIQNCIASNSKWVHAEYKKCKLPDPGNDSKHHNHARLNDRSLSLTLAAPSQRQKAFSGGVLDGRTLVHNAECALQLFK